MRLIYKYRVGVGLENIIETPRRSRFLHAEIDPEDAGGIYLWYEVTGDVGDKVSRQVEIVPTGIPFGPDNEHLATVATPGLELVWHLYECPDEA